MMKDKIVEEVRQVRKEIESEFNNDWIEIGKYLIDTQQRRQQKLYNGKPKSLPVRDVA